MRKIKRPICNKNWRVGSTIGSAKSRRA